MIEVKIVVNSAKVLLTLQVVLTGKNTSVGSVLYHDLGSGYMVLTDIKKFTILRFKIHTFKINTLVYCIYAIPQNF